MVEPSPLTLGTLDRYVPSTNGSVTAKIKPSSDGPLVAA